MLTEWDFVGAHGLRYVEKIRLHNMRARWYNYALFSFISADFYMNLNRYFYADVNPIMKLDITGMNA